MTINDKPAFGEWLRSCRARRGLTQQAYAALLSYDVETLRKVERSRYLSRVFVERVAEVEGIALRELLLFPEVAALYQGDQAKRPVNLESTALPSASPMPVRQPARLTNLSVGLVVLVVIIGVVLLVLGRLATHQEPAGLLVPTLEAPTSTAVLGQVSVALTLSPSIPSPTAVPTIMAPTAVPITSTPTANSTPQLAPTLSPSPTSLATATLKPTARVLTPTLVPTAPPTPTLQPYDNPIALAGNDDIHDLLPNFMLGERVFAGVRFVINDPPNKLSTQCEANPNWPDELTIPIDGGIAHPEAIYMLINAGYTTGSEGVQVGQIELVFDDRVSPPAYPLVVSANVREWLVSQRSTNPGSPDLQEIYRGDSAFKVAGVIDMLRVPIPEGYQDAVLRSIIIQDRSRTTLDSRDPCLFVVGLTLRAQH